jgi:hypothetical protein
MNGLDKGKNQMSFFGNLFNAIFGRTKSVDNQNRYFPVSSRSPEYQAAVEENLRPRRHDYRKPFIGIPDFGGRPV